MDNLRFPVCPATAESDFRANDMKGQECAKYTPEAGYPNELSSLASIVSPRAGSGGFGALDSTKQVILASTECKTIIQKTR